MNIRSFIGIRSWRAFLVLLGVLTGPALWAQALENTAAVRALEAEIERLKTEMVEPKKPDDYRPLVERARTAHDNAVALQATLAGPVAQTEQRIEQLGTDAATSSDVAVRQQHLALTKERSDQVALSRRTALAEVEALQTLNALTAAQTRAIGEQLFQRSPSPLNLSLWCDGLAALSQDLGGARPEAAARATQQPLPKILIALALWAAVAWLLHRFGQRALDRAGAKIANLLNGREPHYARSVFALWSVVMGVLLPIVGALLLLVVIHWAALPALIAELAGLIITAAVIGFYGRATVQAILQPTRPRWRLWRMDDEAAALGARAGNALALAIAVVIVIEALLDRIDPRPQTQLFLHAALALLSVALMAYALYVLGPIHRPRRDAETAQQQARRGQVALWVGVGWLAVAVLALLGMLGYVNFANHLSQWAVWGAVVILSTYILMALVDGLCKQLATLNAKGRIGQQADRGLQQAAVLLSAIGRLLLLLLACGALLVPFGAGFTSVLGLLAPLATGFEVGGVTISVAALLRALLAFVVVVTLVKFARAWITNSYLPTTALQSDARDSIDKILRYLGVVLAVLWALTAFGVGVEKVAILASALSVGIGFGLQAITQNFVSGLILLVERPVKIGDWVKLSGVEGDIRRINVRSTEIRVSDHSTMIVPNSELITKVVQNMTKGSSLGRAQFFLSVPLGSDLEQTIEVVMQVLSAQDDVLESPAPAVLVDRIESGMAVLNCLMHVRSPRVAYGARSRAMLATLRAFRERGLPVSLPPQAVETQPSPR